MPQSIITANIHFGNNGLPNGQGVMAWMSLADFASWFPLKDFAIPGDNRKLGHVALPYVGREVHVSDDFAGKLYGMPCRYFEGPGTVLGAAKAQLSQAGEQYLSFDNKVTATLVKLATFGTPRNLRKFDPKWWELADLAFFAKEPFFADLASTTPAGFPITQGGAAAPGTTAITAIAYAGSVRTFPVFTLNVPSSSANKTTQLVIKNLMSGEGLTINFNPVLAAGVAWTVTVDCAAGTVVDNNGVYHDHQGSFPLLYGPPGTSQNFATTVVTDVTGNTVTIGCSYNNRWEL